MRLYLDGVQAGYATAPMSTAPTSALLVGTSGSCPGGQSFPGIVDDVRIYSRALTSEEVTQLVTGAVPASDDASRSAGGLSTQVRRRCPQRRGREASPSS